MVARGTKLLATVSHSPVLSLDTAPAAAPSSAAEAVSQEGRALTYPVISEPGRAAKSVEEEFLRRS